MRGNWLKEIALPVGAVLMELCWLAPWSILLAVGLGRPAGQPLLSAPGMVVIMLCGYACLCQAIRRGWSRHQAQLALVAVGVIVAVGAVRLDYFAEIGLIDGRWLESLFGQLMGVMVQLTAPVGALIAGLVVYSRGLALARGELDDYEVGGRFRTALTAQLLFLIAAGLLLGAAGETVILAASGFVLGQVFIGLITLSLARLETVREQGRLSHGRAPAINQHWLGLLLGIVGSLLAITIILGQLFSVNLVGALIVPIVRTLAIIIAFIVISLTLPLAIAMEWLVDLIRQNLPDRPPRRNDGGLGRLMELLRDREVTQPSPELLQLIQTVLTIAAIAAGLIILARAIFWWRARDRPSNGNEERDSVWDWRHALASLTAWWRRWRGRQMIVAPALVADSERPSAVAGVLDIREIYRRLLHLGVSVGVPRAIATTPQEHLTGLQASLAPPEAVAGITAAYIEARYGPEIPSPALVEAARSQLDQLHPSPAPPGDPQSVAPPE